MYFIAEMSANHGNNLDIALQIVDAAAASGANCLKVQTYTADTMTLDCNKESFRIEGGLWGGRYLYELYEEASFPWEWHAPIKERCDELGIDFLSTPFDETAVDFLCDLGVSAFKIASFELTDIPLLRYAASKGKRMIISTGMGSLEEIGEATEAVRGMGNDDIVLLRCCSEYPANYQDMNLASIPDMAQRFNVQIGFSDHSEGYLADVAAAVLGACVIEKHFCLSREIETPDSKFSMTPEEFKEMVQRVNDAISSIGAPCYGAFGEERASLAFRRSIFACRDIAKGDVFSKDNIRVVRPSCGAHPRYYSDLIGKRSDREYAFGDPIDCEASR